LPCRWLLLGFIVAALCVSSFANEIERHLRDEYKGKVLLLRSFPEGDRLAYDSNGALVTAAREGDWTSFAIVQIREVKIDRNQVKVDAARVHANPTDDGFQLISAGRVRMVADLGLEQPTVEKAEALLSKIFLNAHDDFSETVQDYWKPCVFAALSGSAPREYRGCRFSSDFLGIRGVAAHPDDRLDPKSLPPTIAKSLSYEVFRPGKGITPPKKISGDEPEFTDEARRARFSGGAVLGVVVGPTGGVEKMWVISPASYGLTLASLEAIAKWRFQPATKDGQAVAVQVEVETSFKIQK